MKSLIPQLINLLGVLFTISCIIISENIADRFPPIMTIIHFPSFLIVGFGMIGLLFAIAHFSDVMFLLQSIVGNSASAIRGRRLYADKMAANIAKDYYSNQLNLLDRYVKDQRMPQVWRIVLSQLEAKIKPSDIIVLLENHSRQVEKKFGLVTNVLFRLVALAPALGLFGTVVGMIKLLGNLEDFSAIGKNMSLALICTLYGIFFANIVIFPLVAKLENIKNGNKKIMEDLIHWLQLVDQKKPSFYFEVNYDRMPKISK
jgi:chemotaxis protein MotA